MLQISKGHDLEQNSRRYVHLYDMSDLYEINICMSSVHWNGQLHLYLAPEGSGSE